MPLGLELSATWLKTLSCQEIANEISRGLDFLETSLQDLPERQRSIRAVFDYSWNLLNSRNSAYFHAWRSSKADLTGMPPNRSLVYHCASSPD